MIWYNSSLYRLRLINISGILELHRRKRSNAIERNNALEEGKSLITNNEKENIDYFLKGKNAISSLPP